MRKKELNIFNKIEKVRSKNNKNWMDLLRLSYEYAPKKTLKILSKIIIKDQTLVKLAKKLKKQ
tara:strand:- start:247 stop:435 length:189 start_codon:yes stop_codon:yes gene_type:complete